jgi:hypothetical protein
VRWRAVDEPIRDAACSANLPCDRVGDTIFRHSVADGAETVFIFVAFRGFAQFSDNQRKRTQSRNEKAGDDDHNYLLSIICAIISRFELFRTNNTLSRFSIREPTREMSVQTERAQPLNFSADSGPPDFYRHNLSDFGQFCQTPNTC